MFTQREANVVCPTFTTFYNARRGDGASFPIKLNEANDNVCTSCPDLAEALELRQASFVEAVYGLLGRQECRLCHREFHFCLWPEMQNYSQSKHSEAQSH